MNRYLPSVFAFLLFIGMSGCGSGVTEEQRRAWSATQKQNLSEFKKQIPGIAQPYVAYVGPHVEDNYHDASVQLEKTWDELSIKNQRDVMQILAYEWFEVVKKSPVDDSQPRLWLTGPDGSLVDALSPAKQ